jgi:hypothetical protein
MIRRMPMNPVEVLAFTCVNSFWMTYNESKLRHFFLNKVEHHLDVVEVGEDDAPRMITPTKPLNKTPSYRTENRVRESWRFASSKSSKPAGQHRARQ